jgi:hypothetical protein
MAKPKSGSANIKKIGHTYSGRHGSAPNAQVKGGSNTPTEQSFK